MMSFWHKKKNGSGREEQQDNGGDERSSEQYEQHQRSSEQYQEADERTRLLPQVAEERTRLLPQVADERTRLVPRDNPVYLSPDDPAVSPYNLWSIRALRGLSSVLLAVSCIWWVFQLVSLFVSPPMMHSRGSGFLSFSYTTLTVGYLLIILMFFAVPSKPMTIWGSALAIFLFVDMCIILGVPRIRVEEGWVGIASVVWATVISIYILIQSRSVAWGKRQEEERLTGREETRRSLREWIAVLIETVLITILAVVSILFTASLILRASDASLAPPGKKYYVNGEKYQVHLACVGNVTDYNLGGPPPTVLVEGGENPVEHTLQPFIDNAYQSGMIGRYCYWDRPGFAWSDNAPSPHSAGMAADALSEALALAGEEGPWVLVSAGVGGIYGRIFSSRHPGEVKGILLIDAMHEDYLGRLGGSGRGFVIWLRGIFSPLSLDHLAGAIFKGRTREDRTFGRSSYQTGKFLKAKLQENLVAKSITASEIQTARHIQPPDTPLMVASSGIEVHRSEKWAKTQEDLTKITRKLKEWDIVKGAPHEIWTSVEGSQVLEKRLRQLVKGE